MKIVINYRTGNVTGNIATYNDEDDFVIPKPGAVSLPPENVSLSELL